MRKCWGTRERSYVRRLSVLSGCTREKTQTPTRSFENWSWTMKPNEGSWLSILTQSRFVFMCLAVFLMMGCPDLWWFMITNNVYYVLLECRVRRSRQYPFTRYASRPLQYPYPRHPTPRGSATLHTEEKLLLWVDIRLHSGKVLLGKLIKWF